MKKNLIKLCRLGLKLIFREQYLALRAIIFKLFFIRFENISSKVLNNFTDVEQIEKEYLNILSGLDDKIKIKGARICLQYLGNEDLANFYDKLSAEGFKVFSFGDELSKEMFLNNCSKVQISKRHLLPSGVLAYQFGDVVIEATFDKKNSVSTYDQPEVDIVYTWVNGDDENWIDKKNQALGRMIGLLPTSNSSSRFKSRDELKYSIRSVLMYAPWVRKIYIITDNQKPEWFVETDRIKLVDHSEIFPDVGVLPVFNSHAIESCLHLIPDLSEYFLYLNDDVLFSKPCKKDDFFNFPERKTKFFFSNSTFIPEKVTVNDLPVDVAAYNNISFLNKEFGYFSDRKFQHTPISLSKSNLSKMEKKHPEIFDSNRLSKVRSANDFSIVSSLYHHYGLIDGFSEAAVIQYDYINLADKSYKYKLEYFLNCDYKRRPKVICINDVDSEKLCQNEISFNISRYLEALYPYASECES